MLQLSWGRECGYEAKERGATPCFNSSIPVIPSPDQSEGGVQTAGVLLGRRGIGADHPPPPSGLSDGGRQCREDAVGRGHREWKAGVLGGKV